MTNELFNLAAKRRSIRRYTGEKVADEVVNEILKVALLAPSSWGRHPIEFVVVRDKEMIKKFRVASEWARVLCLLPTLQ